MGLLKGTLYKGLLFTGKLFRLTEHQRDGTLNRSPWKDRGVTKGKWLKGLLDALERESAAISEVRSAELTIPQLDLSTEDIYRTLQKIQIIMRRLARKKEDETVLLMFM